MLNFRKMKKFILLITFCVWGINAYSQHFNDYMEVSREVLKTEKKALIAEVMQLTKLESETFWPLYNEYQQKRYNVNTKLIKLIIDYAENYEKMPPEKATQIINSSISIDMELLKLEKTYAKKFMKILPPKKALRYLQAENKIEALIDAELAMEIPLLESIEE